jgi:O-antigen ligase
MIQAVAAAVRPYLKMHESGSRTLIVLFGGFVLLALVLLMRPDYMARPEVLGSLVFAQILIASLCKYQQSFFMVLMAAFFWAGMEMPFSGAWLEGRWIVLAVGSFVGLAIYMKNRNHRFATIHLVALSCVLSAVVSASVSTYPQEALLKSGSLFFLFLYGTTGARLAITLVDPQIFVGRLLLVAEVVTYISAIAYFVLHSAIFGNPNSLGAVMGTIVVPLVLWGFLRAEATITKRRLGFELCLAIALLMSSFSRASIIAASVSCFLICIVSRLYRLIIGGVAAAVIISILVVMFVPPPQEDMGDGHSNSIVSLFLYKGKPDQGILGSRKKPWDTTMAVIRDHPWFGSGFGTSVSDQSASYFELTRTRFVDSRMIREHGNSYLAIMEWSGLLGVLPFYALVATTVWHSKNVLAELRRTGNILSPAVPIAAIVLAGLIGAAFEDWLFAVGYYVSVFFWSMAFILADLASAPMATYQDENTVLVANPQLATLAAR